VPRPRGANDGKHSCLGWAEYAGSSSAADAPALGHPGGPPVDLSHDEPAPPLSKEVAGRAAVCTCFGKRAACLRRGFRPGETARSQGRDAARAGS